MAIKQKENHLSHVGQRQVRSRYSRYSTHNLTSRYNLVCFESLGVWYRGSAPLSEYLVNEISGIVPSE